jgi:hypothetical protein
MFSQPRQLEWPFQSRKSRRTRKLADFLQRTAALISEPFDAPEFI